jgi:hypothetical protein
MSRCIGSGGTIGKWKIAGTPSDASSLCASTDGPEKSSMIPSAQIELSAASGVV